MTSSLESEDHSKAALLPAVHSEGTSYTISLPLKAREDSTVQLQELIASEMLIMFSYLINHIG